MLSRLTLTIALLSLGYSSVHAQILVEQDFGIQEQNGKLAVGFADLDNNVFIFPNSYLTRGFLPTSVTRPFPTANEPGFFALQDGSPSLPSGFNALPSNEGLYWDFLPFTVDGDRANLFYWDGLDDGTDGVTIDDVDFQVSTGVEFTFNTSRSDIPGSGEASVFGDDLTVEGMKIVDTDNDGEIHRHGQFLTEPTGGATSVPDGVYLVSMHVRMDGLETSDPFFLAMRTWTIDGTTAAAVAAEVAAGEWIEANLDMLLSEPLEGDFNNDGFVNAADYTVWRDGLDAGDFTANDYLDWRNNYGASNVGTGVVTGAGAASALTAAPEPTAGVLLAASLLGAALGRRR